MESTVLNAIYELKLLLNTIIVFFNMRHLRYDKRVFYTISQKNFID